MSLIKGLDERSKYNVGEKCHIQLNWSEKIDELIVQFYFQLIRSDNHDDLIKQFDNIMSLLKNNYDEKKILTLLKLTANCRDIFGKGERDLSYMLLFNWWLYNPKFAYFLFENFIYNSSMHPYGSWSDVKKMCEYIRKRTNNTDHKFINYIVKLSNYYLKQDYENLLKLKNENQNNIKISLCGKWLPREKSKYKWLHKKLAFDMFPQYLKTCKNNDSKRRAILKCKIQYTKILTTLNEYLDTTQIKMCNKSWKYINFDNVTSKTIHLQKLSFLNKKKVNNKLINRYDISDRLQCSNNFNNYIENLKKNNKTLKGKRCNVYEFVKDALKYEHNNDENNKKVKEIINEQWKDNKQQNDTLSKIIPMADVSGSMECDNCIPLYNSIGLSIRISEKTHPVFKNRILTFSENPSWVKLSDDMTFCDKVYKVRRADWGGNTNIYKAMELICDTLIYNNIEPNEVKNLTLCILSDMQIDNTLMGKSFNTLYDNIKLLFNNAGLQTKFKTPYEPPHILFWNLRKTSGFPVKSDQKNVTMISGYNELLLNVFREKGMKGLEESTPIDMLNDILDNNRYHHIKNVLQHRIL